MNFLWQRWSTSTESRHAARLITHKLPLEKINDAFELVHEGASIRTVIEH